MHVLIVSTMGAQQKAIQALCASIPEIDIIETAFSTQQALEMIKNNQPSLIILGSNIIEGQVCELLDQIETLPEPPHCVVLTLTEFDTCFHRYLNPNQIVPTRFFANRLPEILNEVGAN